MLQQVIALEVPAESDTDGASIDISRFVNKTLIVTGITGTTLHVELSNDDTTFVKVGSDVTGDSVVKIDEQAKYLRIHTETYGSGTPAVSLAALNHRTE